MTNTRPTIHLLHHLARSGGTLFSRCLAAMRGVTLLSEIHPRGAEVAVQFDALFQAQYWFKLLSDAEVRALREEKADIGTCVARIAGRAAERREALVVRDWSHIDFMARPFFQETPCRSALADALADSCRVVRYTTVRHPAAQWLSWEQFALKGTVPLADYMAGTRRFAEAAAAIGFVRYEDFTANPNAGLQQLCRGLGIAFDADWAYRWFFCRTVSGDIGSLDRYSVEPVRPPRVTRELHDALEQNADYLETLDLLGYSRNWIEIVPGPARVCA